MKVHDCVSNLVVLIFSILQAKNSDFAIQIYVLPIVNILCL